MFNLVLATRKRGTESMVQTLEENHLQIVDGKRINPGEVVRVMIVDTHTLMREALHRVVATFPRIQVCASLGTLPKASLIAQKMQAHVIILGSSVPVSDCLNFVRLASKCHASAGIVVIQRCLSPETTMTFIKQDVNSLLGEDASEEDLAKAITAAATGNTFLDRRARELLAASVFRVPIHLTMREVEVLSLLKCGESNFRIAHVLGVKEKTVEKHLSRIYEKLNVSSRTGAILQAQNLQI